MKHFYGYSLPTADSSWAVVCYWRKDVHLVLVNGLGSLPRNSVVRLTDRLDMTVVVDWDVQPQIKTNKKINQTNKIKGLISHQGKEELNHKTLTHKYEG